ncbi:18c46693-5295-4a5d-b2a6-927f8133cc9e [Sclerotinia trifoliorum]|uniref:18c46693-5295-4a5d-b2a6-927f8133cc9e n=1 Tax=Sclerotinia trifoliorum TaxID=28548 RepID=A0A8H2VU84_9HELO|nr:18c46693-5295-4a5d-b2a6-927f8133cc9e [Sclerotinia trifoliorum]
MWQASYPDVQMLLTSDQIDTFIIAIGTSDISASPLTLFYRPDGETPWTSDAARPPLSNTRILRFQMRSSQTRVTFPPMLLQPPMPYTTLGRVWQLKEEEMRRESGRWLFRYWLQHMARDSMSGCVPKALL